MSGVGAASGQCRSRVAIVPRIGRASAGLLLWFSILLIGSMHWAAAQEPAAQDQAAKETAKPTLPPLSIGVLISSDSDRCYDAGVIKAIRKFTLEEAAKASIATAAFSGAWSNSRSTTIAKWSATRSTSSTK